ncbi:hypothetical protein GQ457_12G025480 [Hibiscus cannabinus]
MDDFWELSYMIVWIRLPGLPYRYYTKSLFKRIAAVIGQVVRVDYNTLEGERVKFARLAVMGLNLICFTCGMYGHVKDVCGASKENEQGKPNKQDTGVDKAAKNCVGGMDVPAGADSSSGREGNPDVAVSDAEAVATRIAEPGSLLEEVGGGSKVPVVLLNESQERRMEQSQVLPKISHSAKGTHAAIVIRDKENKDPDGSVTGRKSGGPIRTTKIAPKRGIALHKHGPSKGGSTSILSEWIPAAMANIDRVAQGVVQHTADSSLLLGAESGLTHSAQAGCLEDSVDVDNSLGGRHQSDQDYFQKLFSSSGSEVGSYQIRVKFWTDEWLGDIGPLTNHVVSREWLRTKDFMVRDMVALDGEWKWSVLNSILPITIRLRLAATKTPCEDGSDDFPVWRPNRNRQFTVRTSYEFKTLHVTDSAHPVWRVIAAFRGWLKVRIFMWLACHERLLTNMERMWRHMTSDSSCTVCGAMSETVDHVLRQCPLVKSVWMSVVKPDRIFEFLSMDLKAALVWSIWLRRNRLIFELAPSVCKPVLLVGNRMVEEFRAAVTAGRLTVRSSVVANRAGVRWEAPPFQWCKLNVDGACDSATGRASCGGAIRSDLGQWLMGFSRHLGLCSSLEAELWGIFEGLLCA